MITVITVPSSLQVRSYGTTYDHVHVAAGHALLDRQARERQQREIVRRGIINRVGMVKDRVLRVSDDKI